MATTIRIANVSDEIAEEILAMLQAKEVSVGVQVVSGTARWSVEHAQIFVQKLTAVRARWLLEALVTNEGQVSADDVREQVGSLRGLISPLNRTLSQLVISGELPQLLLMPVKLNYGARHPAYKTVESVIMSAEAIGPFKSALGRSKRTFSRSP